MPFLRRSRTRGRSMFVTAAEMAFSIFVSILGKLSQIHRPVNPRIRSPSIPLRVFEGIFWYHDPHENAPAARFRRFRGDEAVHLRRAAPRDAARHRGEARAHYARLRDVREAQPGEEQRRPRAACLLRERPRGGFSSGTGSVEGEAGVVGLPDRPGPRAGHGGIFRPLLERDRFVLRQHGAVLGRPGHGETLRPVVSRGDGRRHGRGAGASARPPRHRASADGQRRVDGGDAGAPVARRLPGSRRVGHPDRDDRAPLAAADRLQPRRPGGDPRRPRVPRGRLLRMEDRSGTRPVRGADGGVHHLPLGPEDAREIRPDAADRRGKGKRAAGEVGRRDDRAALLHRILGGRVPEAPGRGLRLRPPVRRQLVPLHHEGDRHLRSLRVLGAAGEGVREREVEVPDHLLRHRLALSDVPVPGDPQRDPAERTRRGVPRALDDPRARRVPHRKREAPRGGQVRGEEQDDPGGPGFPRQRRRAAVKADENRRVVMPKKIVLSFLVVLLAAGLSACSVMQSTYQRKVDEADLLTNRLAALQKKNDDLIAENAVLKADLARLTLQNEKLATDLSYVTDQRDKAVSDREELERILRSKSDSLSQSISELRRKVADLDAENAKLKAENASLVKAREEQVQKVSSTYENMIEKMKSEISKGQITISELKGKLTVNMVDSILFDSGRAEVKKGGLEILGKVVSILKDVNDKSIRIEGRPDNVQISRALAQRYPTNWELSAARAINVTRFLQDQGIDPGNLSAAAYGEWKPVATNDTAEGKAKNRRIEIILVPKE